MIPLLIGVTAAHVWRSLWWRIGIDQQNITYPLERKECGFPHTFPTFSRLSCCNTCLGNPIQGGLMVVDCGTDKANRAMAIATSTSYFLIKTIEIFWQASMKNCAHI